MPSKDHSHQHIKVLALLYQTETFFATLWVWFNELMNIINYLNEIINTHVCRWGLLNRDFLDCECHQSIAILIIIILITILAYSFLVLVSLLDSSVIGGEKSKS